jgi:cation-transporting ATPase 13A1
LLSGSAVVDEAILTGESQPLVKECIAQLDDIEDLLSIKGVHKSHILNSGTDILQHLAADPERQIGLPDGDMPHLAKAPEEDAIICYVLKNGFETK